MPRFCCGIVLLERTGGATTGEGEGSNIAGDDAAGCDDGVTADGDAGKDDGIGAYPDIVFNGDRRSGYSLRNDRLRRICVVVIQTGNDDSLCQVDVVADADGTDDGIT